MITVAPGIIAAIVSILFISRRLLLKTKNGQESKIPSTVSDFHCCGVHEICDNETLIPVGNEIVYYQDEELDAFRLKDPATYSTSEIDQFREVLYTMHDNEVAGWLRSLQLRAIDPPRPVREEALMIIADEWKANPGQL